MRTSAWPSNPAFKVGNKVGRGLKIESPGAAWEQQHTVEKIIGMHAWIDALRSAATMFRHLWSICKNERFYGRYGR
jgi:hypothetical protein